MLSLAGKSKRDDDDDADMCGCPVVIRHSASAPIALTVLTVRSAEPQTSTKNKASHYAPGIPKAQ
jgi:hypothetical protein